ncbi:MAG TPA: recombinase family protein [Dehalococcoidia bacterium]|nr:recombinase family protein [Dehalococcoidia bacterium]
MQTIEQIIESRRQLNKKPGEQELRLLPYKTAYIYGRLSSLKQVRDSHESIREIARLLELAIADGYKTSLSPDDIGLELDKIRDNPSAVKLWVDGEVTNDVRDLGISGQLSYEDRQGLADLQRKVDEGSVGAVYLTEGVSRLSRDKDRILPYQLLKLLKEHQCRIRTLEGVWNPAIDRDFDYLAEEFEDAIGELKVMNRRMFRRKRQKAGRGEYVGESIVSGYLLPITGQKLNGEYEYGKIVPYQPHADVVNRILEEFVKQNGNYRKTLIALGDLTFPFFPAELQYMERLTSLRTCKTRTTGYRITWSLIKGLARNLKLIGIWQWGDTDPIIGNHEPIVSEELFMEAYRLVSTKGKPRGKAASFELMQWSGLLYCVNHPEPRRIQALSSKGRYTCNYDYFQEAKETCMDITGRFLDEPLSDAVLRQLDLTAFTEEILLRLESESNSRSIEETQSRQLTRRLEGDKKKWQALLPSCVDENTGEVNHEREDYYWNQIHEIDKQLEEIRSRPAQSDTKPVDYSEVRGFLQGISSNWQSYSPGLKNRFLRLLIDKVEISGDNVIEAVIFWKNGFRQKVTIYRPPSNSKLERRWTQEEDDLLRLLYKTSSDETLRVALPGRTMKAITLRGNRMNLRRSHRANKWRRWSREDDNTLIQYFEDGMAIPEIAEKLCRSESSIQARIKVKNLQQSRKSREKIVRWEISDLIPSQQSSTRGGYRG